MPDHPAPTPERSAPSLTDAELVAIEERAAKASPGPWRSMRDGNQRINTKYLPTAKLVGASRVDGLVRPWNPYALLASGFKPEEYETARFLDEDADFIARAREDIPALIAEVRRLQSELLAAERRGAEGEREAIRPVLEHIADMPRTCDDWEIVKLAPKLAREALEAARARTEGECKSDE